MSLVTFVKGIETGSEAWTGFEGAIGFLVEADRGGARAEGAADCLPLPFALDRRTGKDPVDSADPGRDIGSTG